MCGKTGRERLGGNQGRITAGLSPGHLNKCVLSEGSGKSFKFSGKRVPILNLCCEPSLWLQHGLCWEAD